MLLLKMKLTYIVYSWILCQISAINMLVMRNNFLRMYVFYLRPLRREHNIIHLINKSKESMDLLLVQMTAIYNELPEEDKYVAEQMWDQVLEQVMEQILNTIK
jgi:hypothetical protein